MLVFVENVGHKYDFQGEGVVSGWVWEWGCGPDPKKKSFNRLLIHISNVDRYQCLKLVYSDSLSSFFTKLSNNNMGGITWASDAPCDASMTPPMLLFDNLVKKLDKLSL